MSEPTFEDVEDALLEGDRTFAGSSSLAALGNRTYRIVFFGAFASNIGSWMQNVVLGALAYELTKSSEFVGLLALAQLGPLLLLSLVGGAIADRFDRRKVLIWVAVEQTIFSVALAFEVRGTDPSRVWMLVFVLAVGIGQAVFAPTFTAILPGLVGKDRLPSAIALNSAQMNASRVIGPAIGAFAYVHYGASWVFAGNAVSYVFIIISMMMVTLPPAPAPGGSQGLRGLLSGVAVARADRVIGRCLVTIYVFSFFSLPFVTQMPALASDNLGIAPKSATYGWLYATFGMGAVIGALTIGGRRAARFKPYLPQMGMAGFALSLAMLALVRAPAAAFPVIFVVGFTYFATITALSTVLQERVEDAMRGRVMALWIMGFGGTVPLGALAAGRLIDATSVTVVLLGGAAVAAALVGLVNLREPRPGTPATGPVGIE